MNQVDVNFSDLQIIYSENIFQQLLVQTNKSRCYFWHIALPKSGSTWITKVLISLLSNKGWFCGTLVPAYGKRTQEIDPRLFFMLGDVKTNTFFIHQHCICSKYTERLIEDSNLMAFLQVRNIFDATISLFDHFCKIKTKTWSDINELLPDGFEKWSDSMLLDYVIDIEIPWYIKFLDSWLSSPLVINNNIYVIKYEMLVNDPVNSIQNLLTFAQIKNITDEEIEKALTSYSQNTMLPDRFNKGLCGRGKEELSNKQIAKITKYMTYYPNTDFSDVI